METGKRLEGRRSADGADGAVSSTGSATDDSSDSAVDPALVGARSSIYSRNSVTYRTLRDGLRRAWNGITEKLDLEIHSSGGTDPDREGAEGVESSTNDGSNSLSDSDSTPALFECPECGTVYIDLDKEACRRCRVKVTEVRSTIARE